MKKNTFKKLFFLSLLASSTFPLALSPMDHEHKKSHHHHKKDYIESFYKYAYKRSIDENNYFDNLFKKKPHFFDSLLLEKYINILDLKKYKSKKTGRNINAEEEIHIKEHLENIKNMNIENTKRKEEIQKIIEEINNFLDVEVIKEILLGPNIADIVFCLSPNDKDYIENILYN